MRSYLKTHPWLTFFLDLRKGPAPFWLNLGECQSKCEHIAGVPLRPSTADQLHRVFLAKGALATTAIEGNTLSEEEVLRHFDGDLKLPPSREYLKQEIDNIVSACNNILEEIEAGASLTLSAQRICDLNRRVLMGLAVDAGVIPGQVRTVVVGVARYRGAPPEDCMFLLEQLANWLSGPEFLAPSGMEIVYAIIRAVIAHLYIAWIHPFGDGNGRTARLVEYQILIQSGVPGPAAHLLSNHYNQTRTEYYRQLELASKGGGDPIPFLRYAVEGFRDGLRAQLDLIRQQQWDIAWADYVYDQFRSVSGRTSERRRHLVLDLSDESDPVELAGITKISPRVAAAYAVRGPKTVARDLNALLEMKLISKDERGRYRAAKERILAFLPLRARNKKT